MTDLTLDDTSIPDDVFLDDTGAVTHWGIQIKWDITGIDSGSTINTALISLEVQRDPVNNDVVDAEIWRIAASDSWTDASAASVFVNQTILNNTTKTANPASYTNGVRNEFDVKTQLQAAIDASESTLTLRMADSAFGAAGIDVVTNNAILTFGNDGAGNDNAVDFHSEGAATADAPKLIINFTAPPSAGGDMNLVGEAVI